MMLFKAMVQRIYTNRESQGNHAKFKVVVVNDINAENRKAGEHQWQDGAVNGTGNRCGDAEKIIIDPEHSSVNCLQIYSCYATKLQLIRN